MTDPAAPADPGSGARTYRAFISYSHRDRAVATRLHRTIEAYRIPAKLVGTKTPVGEVTRKVSPLFRDRDELPASADLGSELRGALTRSMFLIVICSPASAKSQWVYQEILQFKRMHGGDSRVLALIVDGTPYASEIAGQEDNECFPKSLRFKLGPDGELSDEPAEPIAADMRSDADGWRLAYLKLIAGLTGLKLADLVQREAQRRAQRLAAVATGSAMGMVLTGGLAFYANERRIEANEQRVIAQKEAVAARAASDFLVGTFEVSNPATENPRTITALTILSRSGDRARKELAGQPEIQMRLMATLGRVYNNLGLFAEAQNSLESSVSAAETSGPDGADPLLTLAFTYFRQGALDKAAATVKRAEQLLGPDVTKNTLQRGEAALTEGRILRAKSQLPEAEAAYGKALEYFRKSDNVPPKTLARALNNRGFLLSDEGKFDEARKSMQESLAIYRREVGDNDLLTGQAWFALSQNSSNAGRFAEAENEIANALKVERVVLDPDNPTIATTLSVQGQILEELGKLPQAEKSLRDSVAIYRKAFGGPHFQIGIAEVYLALIQSKEGDTKGALATLDDAKHNYDVGYGKLHPNHGDLMINRAKVLARAGRMAEAKTSCAEGVSILEKTLGADAAFTKSSAKDCQGLKAG